MKAPYRTPAVLATTNDPPRIFTLAPFGGDQTSSREPSAGASTGTAETRFGTSTPAGEPEEAGTSIEPYPDEVTQAFLNGRELGREEARSDKATPEAHGPAMALKYVEDALARLEGSFGIPAENDPSIDAQVTRDLWIAQSYLGGRVGRRTDKAKDWTARGRCASLLRSTGWVDSDPGFAERVEALYSVLEGRAEGRESDPLATARASERAAIVAWLRAEAERAAAAATKTIVPTLRSAAERIERGDHRTDKENTMHPDPPEHIMQFFAYEHLPTHLQVISKPFGELAQQIVFNLPRNPERTVALRKLLEAKDAAVRAAIAKEG